MSHHYKYSIDFLPSGDVQMSLEANLTTAAGLKIFEILAAEETKRPAARKKTSAKRTSKKPN
jgi:hypothetical protein